MARDQYATSTRYLTKPSRGAEILHICTCITPSAKRCIVSTTDEAARIRALRKTLMPGVRLAVFTMFSVICS